MKDQLLTLLQTISEDSSNAISLLESGDGHLQLGLPDGVTTEECGLDHHHASHSQLQETKKEKTMNDTYGQPSLISSASASLQSSLESRLRQQLDTDGSAIYKLTWKQKATPAQWQYCQLAASVPRIKGIDSSMSPSDWPTPRATEIEEDYDKYLERMRNSKHTKNQGKTKPNNVSMAASLVEVKGWATPNTMDHMALRSDEALLRQVTTTRKGRTFPANLMEQVDPKSQEIYATGQIPNTPTVETESTAKSQLNPRFSLWLMGYPIEWAYCGERVTLSSRKSERK
jgi:hypothetical protein